MEIRGVKDEELCEKMNGLAESNNAPPNTLTEMLEVLRKKRKVTGERLKKAKLQVEAASKKKEKRTRKNKASWNYVIEKLVEEGLLDKKISRQALKKMLKNRYPNYHWDKV